MKKFIGFACFVLCTNIVFAQTIISKNVFEKNLVPLGYHFLPNANRIVFEKGIFEKDRPSVKIIKEIIGYDSDGFYETFAQNENLISCVFAPTEKSFIGLQYDKSENKSPQFKFVIDGNSSDFFKLDNKLQYFNDDAQFAIVNYNNSTKINLEKDDLFLDITDFGDRTNIKFKLQKPDVGRLIGNKNTAYANSIAFGIRVNEENFGIITKSISKDYKSATLYRTIYDYKGKQLKDLEYEVKLENNFLIYCNNGGGNIYTNPKTDETVLSDLNINNFAIDRTTSDVYVYGLFGNSAKNSSNVTNEAAGFYVYKFNKEGAKIWESIQPITNNKKFNGSQNISKINLSITIRINDVLVAISAEESDNPYLMFATLDVNTGNSQKNVSLDFKIDKTINKNISSFLKSSYNLDNVLNKFFDFQSMIAYNDNYTLKKYITEKISDKLLFYKSFLGKQGVWLIESDNLTFYNAIFFKD